MILPKADVLLKKAESEGIFEVFDPKILEDAEESYQGGVCRRREVLQRCRRSYGIGKNT